MEISFYHHNWEVTLLFYLKLHHYFAAAAHTCGYDLTCPPATMAPNRCKRQHLRLSFRCSLSWKHSETHTHTHIWIKRCLLFMQMINGNNNMLNCFFFSMHPVRLIRSSVLQTNSYVLTALMHRYGQKKSDTLCLWLRPLTYRLAVWGYKHRNTETALFRESW